MLLRLGTFWGAVVVVVVVVVVAVLSGFLLPRQQK